MKRKAAFIGSRHGYVSFPSGQRRQSRWRVVATPPRTTRGRYSKEDRELKFHDLDIDLNPVVAAGSIPVSCNLIAQGVTESTRVGRKCTIKSISWRFQNALVEVDAIGTPPPADVVRVILFLDKQANGAAAAVTDILETADFQSFNNLSNSGRFRTLMDRTYGINYTTLASDGAGVVSSAEHFMQDTFFKKCHIPIEYSAGAGVIGEVRTNNIGVLLISRAGTVAFESKMRLRFSDGG